MSGDSFASLIYLVILLTVVGGGFVLGNRLSLGTWVRGLGTWLFLFVGLIAAYGLWGDIQRQFQPASVAVIDDTAISVPRQRDGHFHLRLNINGEPVDFLVDTGATDLVLTRHDAARVGLNPATLAFTRKARTANGVVDIAPVQLEEVVLGSFTDTNVRASVNGGELGSSLLGMSYLSRFETLQIQGNRLTLIR